MPDAPSYGQTRQKRSDVTYAQIERAAIDILKTGTRPTIEGVRAALGGGSPRTILEGLNRYWRDLGNKVSGSPDTMSRLPAAVADLAEGLWQRALSMAIDAAQVHHSDEDGQLSRLKSQLEVRAHTLSQREIELDGLLRSRERTVRELEENLRVALTMLTKRDGSIATLESRITAVQEETEEYRRRLAALTQRAVIKRQRAAPKKSVKPRKSVPAPVHRRGKKPKRRLPARRVKQR